ncbi:MAG: Na(+)/H(+) antiporter subunit D [Deltaproteobacteria bacterium]|nr:Na(+)/H(+) antiporter subunit D [Deltaproteobacteria bacterium]|tara:strand:+ start:4797 stop:6542 length:1746 start_codon:yes stop_codon:yes gene_type:complete
MIAKIPPAFILIFGALLVPLIRNRRIQAIYMLMLPVLGFVHLLYLPHTDGGILWQVSIFGGSYTLTLLRVDKLSLVFGYIFHIAAFLSTLYALHSKDDTQYVSGLIYAGSAIGAVFAGDLITLFVYWEFTAIASVFLIWARRTKRAYSAGMRYLVIQIASGVLLLGGIIFHYRATGSLEFGFLGAAKGQATNFLGLTTVGSTMIFIAFGMKAAFPLLHNWLQDAYPEATEAGTVFLSAFTTKLAIYALARSFPGTESLIWIGATMTIFPIFYAVIENDLRRVLAYSLNNQLGYMVVGIGIGTHLALNGTAAHAFTHILYKSLLFMSMGAVLYRTGTANGSELGGLYKSMPYTTVFCIIGAASISAFPLFNGFISKSLIISAAGHQGLVVTWMILLFASAGVFHHSGIKIPFFAFFAHDSGIRVKEAPLNMLFAMGITAVLCVVTGVFPSILYNILPYSMDYQPYTFPHVITQLQILLWSALAFVFLQKTKLYPPELRSTVLDTDWIYRKFLPGVVQFVHVIGALIWDAILFLGGRLLAGFLGRVEKQYGSKGPLAQTLLTGAIALWAAILLFVYLFFYFYR